MALRGEFMGQANQKRIELRGLMDRETRLKELYEKRDGNVMNYWEWKGFRECMALDPVPPEEAGLTSAEINEAV